MTQREQYEFGDGSLIRFMKHQMGFTPTSGQPDDAQMIQRLAVKAQELAAEEGIELTKEAAMARAQENLAHVRKMAGGVR